MISELKNEILVIAGKLPEQLLKYDKNKERIEKGFQMESDNMFLKNDISNLVDEGAQMFSEMENYRNQLFELQK